MSFPKVVIKYEIPSAPLAPPPTTSGGGETGGGGQPPPSTIPIVSTASEGLAPIIPAGLGLVPHSFLRDDAAWQRIAYADLEAVPLQFAPLPHAISHVIGPDALPLVGTSNPGFAPPLPGTATYYLDGTGVWSVPAGTGGGGGGTPGTPGQPAYTTTTANFTVPPVGGTVQVTVLNTDWIAIGEMLYVAEAAGTGVAAALRVTAKSANSITLLNPPPAAPLADMFKSVYDIHNAGIVDHAALADAVSWTGITGKPLTFAPSAHAPSHAHGGADPVTITYSDLSGIPASFVPSAHATSHKSGGNDPLALDALAAASDSTMLNVSVTAHGLTPKLPGIASAYLDGTGVWSVPAGAGGGGGIPEAPVDGNLYARKNVSWTAFVPGLTAVSVTAPLTGSGTAGNPLTLPATLTPSAHAVTHKSGGSDAIALDTLAATTDILTLNVSTVAHGLCPKAPNDMTKVLRGDGTFGTLAYSSLGSIPSSFSPSPHAASHLSGGSDAIALDALGTPTDVTTLNASVNAHGLLCKLDNLAAHFLDGTGNWSTPAGGSSYTGINSVLISGTNISLVNDSAAPGNNYIYGTTGAGVLGWRVISGLPVAWGSLIGVPASFTPSAHAPTHESGGLDAIPLDTLGATTDITSLNASIGAHGLLPKLAGGTTTFLRADGTWAAPPGATYAGINSITISGTNISLVNDLAAPGNNFLYGTSATGVLGWRTISGLPVAYGSLTGVPATFAPSTHAPSHQSGGGDVIALDTLGAPTDIATLNASTTAHGLLRKLDNNNAHFLDGTGTWSTPPTTSGPPGPAGSSAFTTTVGNFTVPPVGSTTTVTVVDASWIVVGQLLYLDGAGGGTGQAGALEVTAKSGNLLTLFNPIPPAGGGGGGTTYVGIDSINVSGSSISLVNDNAAPGNNFIYGTSAAGVLGWRAITGLPVAWGSLTGVPATFAPSTHAASHQSGGTDIIALDSLAATTDISTLNSSTSAHGLLRKLDNNGAHYLDGTGAWSTPPVNTGPAGGNAYTTTTANFTVPNVGSTATVTVTDASWAIVGEMVWVATAAGAGQGGVMQITGKAGNTLTLLNTTTPGITYPYDIALFAPGKPAGGALLMRFLFNRAISTAVNLAGSLASAGTAATASTVFALAKNGTSIGTLTFAAGATTGSFSVSSAQNLISGDIVTVTAPASADATLADLSVTLTGTRT